MAAAPIRTGRREGARTGIRHGVAGAAAARCAADLPAVGEMLARRVVDAP